MNKKLFTSFVCLLITGWGLKIVPASVKAEIPSATKLSKSTQSLPKVSQVELLSSGAKPRQKLRFKPRVNVKETTNMTMNIDILAMSIDGKPAPDVKLPAIKMTMETVVTKIDSNGDIHYQFSYSDVDLVDATTPTQMLAAMRSQIKKLVGLSGSGILDNRGQLKVYHLTLPEGFDQNTKQMIEQMSNSTEQMSAPVPQQAVGVGAKWRVASHPNLGGINLTQEAIYQLISLQQHIATISVTLKQQAAAQNLTKPGLPTEYNSSTLKSLNSQGQGQITADLNQLIATGGTLSMRSSTESKMRYSSQLLTVDTQLLTQMVIQSK